MPASNQQSKKALINQNFVEKKNSAFRQNIRKTELIHLEQGTGVEPALTAWEAAVIPIYQPCDLLTGLL